MRVRVPVEVNDAQRAVICDDLGVHCHGGPLANRNDVITWVLRTIYDALDALMGTSPEEDTDGNTVL